MSPPEPWECELWEQILESQLAGNRTKSSFFVMAQEAVRQCQESNEFTRGTEVRG